MHSHVRTQRATSLSLRRRRNGWWEARRRKSASGPLHKPTCFTSVHIAGGREKYVKLELPDYCVRVAARRSGESGSGEEGRHNSRRRTQDDRGAVPHATVRADKRIGARPCAPLLSYAGRRTHGRPVQLTPSASRRPPPQPLLFLKSLESQSGRAQKRAWGHALKQRR